LTVFFFFFFFFNDTATTEIYTLSLHDALPIYSSPRDLLAWLEWHLDRFSNERAAERLIDHAAYLWRDGLNAVFGMDESGHMDAMGLGWVIMAPKRDRPLILQKAGGLQGVFSYVAFAPAH